MVNSKVLGNFFGRKLMGNSRKMMVNSKIQNFPVPIPTVGRKFQPIPTIFLPFYHHFPVPISTDGRKFQTIPTISYHFPVPIPTDGRKFQTIPTIFLPFSCPYSYWWKEIPTDSHHFPTIFLSLFLLLIGNSNRFLPFSYHITVPIPSACRKFQPIPTILLSFPHHFPLLRGATKCEK